MILIKNTIRNARTERAQRFWSTAVHCFPSHNVLRSREVLCSGKVAFVTCVTRCYCRHVGSYVEEVGFYTLLRLDKYLPNCAV
jgi:hypothetical protein